MNDFKNTIDEQKKRLKVLADKLEVSKKRSQLKKLQTQSAQPDFWDNPQSAQATMRHLGSLESVVSQVDQLQEQLEQFKSLASMAQKEDQEFLKTEEKKLERQLNKLEKQTYLSGPYDSSDAIVSIHAGQGGTEAMDWTSMLFRMYTRFVENQDWKWRLLDESQGEEAGLKSVVFKVEGSFAYGYLRREAGTHRLVRQSPFNADNLRQTSFSLVEVLPALGEVDEVELDLSDLDWQFFRASSQGGQNVQKVSTAVRLKHLPSGIVVESQTERYQEQNRKNALELLKAKLWKKRQEEREAKIDKLKGSHRSASWGTQIRSYVLHPYKLVKDLRTEYEETDPDSVLDGNLEGFIEAELSKVN